MLGGDSANPHSRESASSSCSEQNYSSLAAVWQLAFGGGLEVLEL